MSCYSKSILIDSYSKEEYTHCCYSSSSNYGRKAHQKLLLEEFLQHEDLETPKLPIDHDLLQNLALVLELKLLLLFFWVSIW